MKLLFENWRGYIFEQEASWVEDLKKDTWAVLDKTKFKEIGSGAYRTVYAPLGDDDYVIKVTQSPRDIFMNSMDVELSNKYPDIVPKTYAHGPCSEQKGETKCSYEWIVMEKVNVIEVEDRELFMEMLKVNFPDIVNFLVTDEKAKKVLSWFMASRHYYVIALWHLVVESINYGQGGYKDYTSRERSKAEAEGGLATPGVMDIPDMPGRDDPGSHDIPMVSRKEELYVYKKIFDIGMQNNVYRQLFKMVSVDEADIFDIGPGNVAIDNKSNFKVLDTSIFDDSF